MQPLSVRTDLNKEATAAIDRAKKNGLLAAFAIDQPTLRALPDYQRVVQSYLQDVTSSEDHSKTAAFERILDITALEFDELDKNHDGWLSRKELREAK